MAQGTLSFVPGMSRPVRVAPEEAWDPDTPHAADDYDTQPGAQAAAGGQYSQFKQSTISFQVLPRAQPPVIRQPVQAAAP